MKRIVLVGSGASGVQFALTALRMGHEVIMLDVGFTGPVSEADSSDAAYDELKTRLDDPVGYFLGDDYSGLLLPGGKGQYYGFPPNRKYVFDVPASEETLGTGFSPLMSFAQGGLAETWTGGSYPFNDHDLAAFPIDYSDLGPYFDEVAGEIGITGEDDDTARFYPVHKHLMPGLRLDEHSERLVERYERHKGELNGELRAFMGRSRVATLSRDHNGRAACDYDGRCWWGCPTHALYTPSITLAQCREFPGFDYRPGRLVTHFEYNGQGEITALKARALDNGHIESVEADRYVLAAGTLSSAKIFLESIRRQSGQIQRLDGIMDNRQLLVPFLNLSMIGRKADLKNYQYHLLMLAIESDRPEHLIHCQITTLKTAAAHPLIQSFPLNLRAGLSTFCDIRAALGLLNVNLYDTRREGNYVTLETDTEAPRLVIHYEPHPGQKQEIQQALRSVRRCLRRLGCIVPGPMVHVRPMGASVHYAGTLPMSTEPRSLTVSPQCRSHDFANLYLADGSGFCFLPAKNYTFAMMANARRIAALIDQDQDAPKPV